MAVKLAFFVLAPEKETGGKGAGEDILINLDAHLLQKADVWTFLLIQCSIQSVYISNHLHLLGINSLLLLHDQQGQQTKMGAWWGPLVPPASLVTQVLAASQVSEVPLDQEDPLDLLVLLDQLDPQAPQDHQVPQDGVVNLDSVA